MTTILALLLGAAWRRWFGAERPSWAFPGFRAMQIVAGILTLGILCYLAGGSFWRAPLIALLATGWLIERAQSIPVVWEGWFRLDALLGPRFPAITPAFTGWTTYAEATAGALVWAIAVGVFA